MQCTFKLNNLTISFFEEDILKYSINFIVNLVVIDRRNVFKKIVP